MRIAIVQQPISILPVPAQSGSLEIWTYEVARRLAKSCDVTVYSRKAGDQSGFEVAESVCYRRVTTGIDDRFLGAFERHPKLKRLPGFRNPERPLFASCLAYLEYSLKVARDLRRRRCEVIHILNFSQIVPMVRAFNRRARIVLNMRCEWLSQLDSRMVGRRIRKCDLVIGCSDYITEKIRCAFPQFSACCHTVYNGVDVSRFVPDKSRAMERNGAKRLLFVGRICPDKGPHVLLEAFEKVAGRHPQVQLELVGWKQCPPPEYVVNLGDDEQTRKLAPFYNANYPSYLEHMLPPEIAQRVTFQKPLAHPELAGHYRNADILVFPSVWNEPFGIPLVEAMATGIPVIATRGGAFPEIVQDGKTGLLVPRGDAPALAEAILRLLEDGDLRRSMGEAGRRRALEKFSFDTVAENLLSEYRSLSA
jgi:glycosyltransferase involved in cell wall biosynthesis